MNEEIQVVTPPTVGDGEGVKTPLTEGGSPAQADNQPQIPAAGKVEPAEAVSSSSDQRRPSDWAFNRQIQRLEKSFSRRLTESLADFEKRVFASSMPAVAKPDPELTDDDFYKMGPVKAAQMLVQKQLAEFERKVPTIWEEHQKEIQYQKNEQEAQQMLDKYRQNGQEERLVQILEENPSLNEFSKRDMLGAFKLIDLIMASETKVKGSPLVPKKSQMAPIGSGQTPGGGSGKVTLAELQAMKDKLQSQLSERRNDPAFWKEWNYVRDQFANIKE